MPVLPQAAAAVPWTELLLLTALCVLSRHVPRCPLFGRRSLPEAGSCATLVFTGVFLLPPPLAALVPVPAAVVGPALPGGRVRRVVRLVGATSAAGCCFRFLTGGRPPIVAEVDTALLPAAGAVTAFAVVYGALAGRLRGPDALWLAAGLHGLLAAAVWQSPFSLPGALLVLLPGYVSCWVLARSRQVAAAQRATVRGLVQAVELKDPYTRGHSERVGRAAAMIAGELGLDAEHTEALRTAGTLHDIGKLGVPTATLRKDGALSREEWRQIRRHPECGHAIVRDLLFLGDAKEAVLHHHERLDGTGYPGGLAGESIPEAARVVAVADAFDAMTSTRSYRPGRPVAAAVAELRRCAGTQFDPRVVQALCQALERHGWPYPDGGVPGTAVPRSGNVPAPRGTGPAGDPAERPGAPGPAGPAR